MLLLLSQSPKRTTRRKGGDYVSICVMKVEGDEKTKRLMFSHGKKEVNQTLHVSLDSEFMANELTEQPGAYSY